MPRPLMLLRPMSPALLLACCGALVGCDRSSSDASLQITEAGRTISNVTSATPADQRASTFSRVSGDLRDLSSVDSAKDAASVLSAQAQAGVAQVALEEAHRLSADILREIADMRVELRGYVRVAASREGVGAQDFSDQFEELDREAAALTDQMDAARSRLAGVEGEILELEERREQLQAAALELREQVVRMKRDVQDASATLRQPVIEDARDVSRRADALEADAARIAIRIDDAQLRARSIRAEIELLERQRQNNSEARSKAEQLERQLRQQRDAFRSDAQARATQILQRYEQTAGTYEQGVSPKFDEAVSGFSQAAGRASGASSVPGGRMSGSNIRLMMASALISRASVEGSLASLGIELADVLPGASALRQRADSFDASARDAMSQAADAYDQSSAALEGAGEKAEAIRVQLGLVEPPSEGDGGFDEDMDG
ncbi:MAG: hypothetical protein Tsb0013_16950 [Phycisphaerales bacterium]